jgi:predicted membrane chloride channel (bestrophin family)
LFQLCWAGSTTTANDPFVVAWRVQMYALCLSFPVILKNALRGSSQECDLRDLNFVMQGAPAALKMIPHIINPKHAPLPRLRCRWVTLLMRGEIDRAYRRGVFSDAYMQVVVQAVPDFEEVAARCSQIKSTPFVFQAAVHFRTLLLLYCCTLPLLLIASELSIITIYVMMIIISFAILGLDEVRHPSLTSHPPLSFIHLLEQPPVCHSFVSACTFALSHDCPIT